MIDGQSPAGWAWTTTDRTPVILIGTECRQLGHGEAESLGLLSQVQAELLTEARRTRKAVESIHTLLAISIVVAFLAAIVMFGISLSQ